MSVVVEKLDDLSKKIEIIIPIAQITSAIKTKLNKMSKDKQVRMNGFRAGHIPENLLKERYGVAVYHEIVEELLDAKIKNIIEEYKLDLIEQIKLESINNKITKPNELNNLEDLKCIFIANIYPDVEISELNELSINIPEVSITEEDIDSYLKFLQKKLADFTETDKPAEMGDLLLIDYINLVEDQKIIDDVNQDKHRDIKVILGENSYIEGFDAGLLGVKAGEDIVLNLPLPSDYVEKSLAGKVVEMQIHIHKISVRQPLALDENFAIKLGIKDGDVSQIRDFTKQQLEEKAVKLIIKKEEAAIKELLLQTFPITVLPEKLVAEELTNLEKDFILSNEKKLGITIKDLNEVVKQDLHLQATNNVHFSLILRKIIQKFKLTVDQNILQQKLKPYDNLFKLMSKNNKNYDDNLYHYLRNSIINSSLIEVAFSFVKQKIQKTTTRLSFNMLTEYQ